MHLGKALVLLILAFPLAGRLEAAVQTQTINYSDGDTPLKGYLAWDNTIQGKRPGILVVHEWWGLNEHAKAKARDLAKLGYVAFAADMYGQGKATTHPDEAGAWSKQVQSNVQQWRERAQKALEVLRDQRQVDTDQLAAIGYCFGGATVLHLAYSGADVKAVASFHGALPLPSAAEAEAIKAKVLVMQGSEDAFVPMEQVIKLQSALDQADIKAQSILFGNTQHAFTNPEAHTHGIENLKYDPTADKLSWRYMQALFDEVFDKAVQRP